jgi:zinc protease
MSEILTMRLLEVIREDKSGAYSIGASAGWEPYLDNQYVVEISFGADPARAQELTAQVFGILSDFKRNLIDPSYIERAQATERSAYETSMQENNFWLQNLQNLNLHERPFTDLLTYPRLLATLTPEAVRDAANSFLNSDSYVQVILYPAEAGKE